MYVEKYFLSVTKVIITICISVFDRAVTQIRKCPQCIYDNKHTLALSADVS